MPEPTAALPDDALLSDGDLREVDPEVGALIEYEEARQTDKLQMIPSESLCPRAVRAAMASVFSNKYAEGYPLRRLTGRERHDPLDIERFLAFHRRYGDRRFYKGTEIMNIVEALAQKRCAEVLATPGVPASEIQVNVQPLSGAAANNAAYEALIKPGDLLMGMSLSHGGHLTHGSPFNRSGRYYKVQAYAVDPDTGRLNYDAIRRQAMELKPRILVAGASAYPWDIDWKELRRIADAVPGRAWLLADISHTAGLAVAGLFPNPVGVADVTMFTTHKTMCGPRGAVLLWTDRELTRRINAAVFPGEQGGPHMHAIAAKAVSFRLAATEGFRKLMTRVVQNAVELARAFGEEGLPLAYGGTNTHMALIDLRRMTWPGEISLTGDVASNLLDLCGITCNKNALAGDETGVRPSGLRFGTVVLSQRGMGPAEMKRIAGLVRKVLTGIAPFATDSTSGKIVRGRIAYELMRDARAEVAALVGRCRGVRAAPSRAGEAEALEVVGERAASFLAQTAAGDVSGLAVGRGVRTKFLSPRGELIDEALVVRLEPDAKGRERYLLVPREVDGRLRPWLTAASDGFVRVVEGDDKAKVDGPVKIVPASRGRPEIAKAGDAAGTAVTVGAEKPFFVGQAAVARPTVGGEGRPAFSFAAGEDAARKTPLHDAHKNLGARMISFAGWKMPVWYASAGEEHEAVRRAAGLFDVGHMAVFEVAGEQATAFLDTLTTNAVWRLHDGEAQYSYVLDVDGAVEDDVIVYRLERNRYMVVANAVNEAKVLAWFRGVNERRWMIDREAPGKKAPGPVEIRDLKDPAAGAARRIDLALQGRASLDVLRRLAGAGGCAPVDRLGRFQLARAKLAGLDVIVSRTGYTGEAVGYEIFVHPDEAERLWGLILKEGEALGVRAAGLAARDSTRTEAGFPLWGHELAGPFAVTPVAAGYGSFVKWHKPFFVGRAALARKVAEDSQRIVRFAIRSPRARTVRAGDPVVDRRGDVIGLVTSCVAIGREQVGLACVDRAHAAPETELGIFPLPRKESSSAEKQKRELARGDKVVLHEPATVLPRFASL